VYTQCVTGLQRIELAFGIKILYKRIVSHSGLALGGILMVLMNRAKVKKYLRITFIFNLNVVFTLNFSTKSGCSLAKDFSQEEDFPAEHFAFGGDFFLPGHVNSYVANF
jgi:hypothetical protein